MPSDTVKSSSPPIDTRRLGVQKRQCEANGKNGIRCRNWAMRGSTFCWRHPNGSVEPEEGKTTQTTLPGSLPGQTKSQERAAENALQYKITNRKKREAAKRERKQVAASKKAWKLAQRVEADADKLAEADATGIVPVVSTTKLRTLEDCLGLIEVAVDEIEHLPASLNKAKVLISAARTAGQLIIQSGVADKAVEWFQENVKLVAGIDLDQI